MTNRKNLELKASKCISLAASMFPKNTPSQVIEDQATDLMDLDDEELDRLLKRLEETTHMKNVDNHQRALSETD